jgi:hypothetical protein
MSALPLKADFHSCGKTQEKSETIERELLVARPGLGRPLRIWRQQRRVFDDPLW